ncbi:DUF1904 family protein [Paenibacillus qinlingensis]|uniref:DUF1904 family protein n=1 Tax=Paenibacillus qinlingensis TaxID=1837343 RepID=UPI0015651A4B|nr:DUF1904 family protein [Paenibacillus qinlingensis]NQX58001.1 DUF1904 family protein [Paenibacillus qinlingensis]
MPFLRFKGFEKNSLINFSSLIIEQFSNLANVPKEIVKMELINVEQITYSPMSVEILMFQRKKEIHDEIAKMMYRILSEHGFTHTHIFFIMLTPSFYYKEGLPLNEIPMLKNHDQDSEPSEARIW